MPTMPPYRPHPLRAALICLMISGCSVGGLATHDTIALRPAGIRMLLELEQGRLVGELLELRSEELVLLADTVNSSVRVDGPVVRVPSAGIPSRFRAGTSWPEDGERGRAVRWGVEADRTWLRGLSRFPYGMSPDVERRLLSGHAQTEMASPMSTPPGGTNRSDVDVRAFVAGVARGVEPFRDRSVAIAHGYRKVGPDFPGMGQHWVNPGLVLSGVVDPSRPQILTYIEVAGAIHLTGAAFAVPLLGVETPPTAPLGQHVWHDHGGSVDEETLILESPVSMHHDVDGPRLAMFHTWLWPENPHGPLAQNNWSLPWVRLGLQPPDQPDPVVSRALSLGGGGVGYYRLLLARAAGLEPGRMDDAATTRIIGDAVARAGQRVFSVLEGRSDELVLAPRDVHELRMTWTTLWDELRRDVGDGAWSLLLPAFEAWGSR